MIDTMLRKKLRMILSWILALTLVFSAPAGVSFAADWEAVYDADMVLENDLAESTGYQADGNVIVCVRGGETALAEALDEGWSLRRYFQQTQAYSVEDVLASFEVEEETPATATESNAEYLIEAPFEEENEAEIVSESGMDADFEDILLIHTRDTESFIRKISQLPCVIYAQPDYICEIETAGGTGEPLYYAQQHLDSAEGGSDLRAAAGWNAMTEASSEEPVVVAVLDSGVDYTHPDLQNVMWDEGLNYPELTALGGGMYGINTSGDGPSDDPMDRFVGHGTHCASVIAGAWDHEGIAGVNGNARIMACCWMNQSGSTSNFIKAVNYIITAKNAGINLRVTSNSWGSNARFFYNSPANIDMERRLSDAGIINVYSSGNTGHNLDSYPENNHLNDGLSLIVGASDSAGGSAVFSDYGKQRVDVYAPGVNVLAAASLQDGVISMPAGYYPWLDQDHTGDVFFCDMENEADIRIAAGQSEAVIPGGPSDEEPELASPSSAEPELASPSNAKVPELASPSTAVMKLYGKEDNHALCFDIDSGKGDFPSFDIGFRLTAEEAALLPDSGKIHISFQMARTGALADPGKTVWNVQVWDTVSGEFETVETLQSIMMDPFWNIAAFAFEAEQFSSLLNEDNELRLRFTSEEKQASAGKSTFYIDNSGISMNAGLYCYSSGTSMACPQAAGLLALIIEKLQADNSDGAKSDMEIAQEALACLKGGVVKHEALSGKCTTGGVISAENSLTGQLCPVPVSLADNGDGTSTLSGYFFGTSQGTVTADGASVSILSWSDRSIVLKNRGGKERDAEIIVKNAAGQSGREFFNFGGTEENGYEMLPPLPVTVSDAKLAAAGDTVLCFADEKDNSRDFALSVWKYDIRTAEWSRVPLPANVTENQSVYNVYCSVTLAAGKTEIYALIDEVKSDVMSVGRLLTYDTVTGTWKHNVEVDIPSCAEGMLCVYNGELLVVGSDDDTQVNKIYPDTGEVFGSLPDMPADHKMGYAFQVGQDIVAAGLYNGLFQLILEALLPGILDFKDNVRYHADSGTWTESRSVFFGEDSEYLDSDTFRQCSAVPLKDGLMITGPVKNNGTAGMIDTWRYRSDTDSYEAYPALFDTFRTRNISSCLLNGKMYVLGASAAPERDGAMRFAFLDISDIAAAGYPDAKKSADNPDPKPKKSGDHYDPLWAEKPRYTGTWGAPVEDGTWYMDSSGIWYYYTNAYFRETWGYIVNPYAKEGDNRADWFWFDRNGHMLTGWQRIGNKWYYLNPVRNSTYGACQLGGITPDQYTLNADGSWAGY